MLSALSSPKMLNTTLTTLSLFMVCMPGTSQTAMDLSAVLVAITILFIFLRNLSQNREQALEHFPRFGWEYVTVMWLFVLAIGFGLSTLPSSTPPAHGGLFRILEIRWMLFAYFLANAGDHFKPSTLGIKVVLGFLAFATLWAIMIFVFQYDPIRPEDRPQTLNSGLFRTGGILGQAIIYGHIYVTYFCFMTGVGLYVARFPKEPIWQNIRKLFFVTYALLASSLIVNFTRGAWMEMVCVLIIGGFIMHRKVGSIVTGLITAGVLALFTFSPGIRERVFESGGGGEERLWIWRANWAIFKDHPWFGVGYGNNKLLLPEYYARIGAPAGTLVSHAHNEYLHMLSGTGVIGTFLYLLFWFLFLLMTWRTFKFYRSHPVYGGLLLGALLAEAGFFIGGLTEANYEHAKLKILLSCIWALVLYFYAKKRRAWAG